MTKASGAIVVELESNQLTMELNIGILLFVVLLAILLILFMIRKNRKDQRELEEKIKRTELGADHHKADKI